jgi:hypothetical protein
MHRRSLGIVAFLLIGLMALVATAGLDKLPPSLHKSVDAASGLLAKDRASLAQDRSQIERDIGGEPDLFQNKSAPWRARLDQDRAGLDAAAAKLASLQQLAKANKRTDGYYVERGLGEFDSARKDALRDAEDIRSEADRWIAAKQAMPGRLEAMHASYDALESAGTDAAVSKAMADWPAKRDDLQKRLAGIEDLKAQGKQIWESTAQLRSSAADNKLAGGDYDNLLSGADRMDADARQAKENLAAIDALASQLYVSWDKVLLEVEPGRDPREKVRTVRTRFPDASLTHGQTTSEESWETADYARVRDDEHDAGMTIEHKPAGEYDSEAERSVEPPAYAYIAPPGQGNSYGAWAGGVWHWLPEYLILSQLLHASRGPVTTFDYDAYQNARRHGEVFYGRNNEYQPRWYDRGASGPAYRGSSESSGGWWKERPSSSGGNSSGDRSYSGSSYRSRGTFSSSQYRSRGSFASGALRSYSRSRGRR